MRVFLFQIMVVVLLTLWVGVFSAKAEDLMLEGGYIISQIQVQFNRNHIVYFTRAGENEPLWRIESRFILSYLPDADSNSRASEADLKPLQPSEIPSYVSERLKNPETAAQRSMNSAPDESPVREHGARLGRSEGPLQSKGVEGKFILAGNFGFTDFALTDFNAKLLSVNNWISGPYLMKGTIPGITTGTVFQGMIGVGVAKYLILGFDAEYLNASTAGSFKWTNMQSGASGSEDVECVLPLTGLGGIVKIAVPVFERFLFTAGVGVCNYTFSGKQTITGAAGSPYPTQEIEFNGSSQGYKLQMGWDFFITSVFALGVDAGYRHARIERVHFNNTTFGKEGDVRWADGSYLAADFSGLFLQGGLRFYF